MSTIVTRSGKGAALTHTEVDANFTNLNADKAATADVILATQKGAASGVCPLDATSKVASTYLPSYVDDVLEYANLAALPVTGETGKIYVALDTNKTYRWSGSAYIYITSGAVDSVAGRTGVVTLTSADVGLGNVTNNAAVANLSGTNTGDQTLPTTLPASDVYAWAKAATKPTYTATEVSLGNANNTSDANKPISTATQTALDLKSPLASPTFTGTVNSANLAYTGTLTGSTGILNIGSGQVYKDASGNVGIGTSSPASKLDIGSGNLNFSGTAQFITGDFTSAVVSRLAFKSNTINGFTDVIAAPNGTGTLAQWSAYSSSDLANSSIFGIRATSGVDARLISTLVGTGTYLPMTFYTSGSEKVRIDTSGNVGIGTTNPKLKTHIQGGYSSPTTSGTTPTGAFLLDASAGGYGLYAGIYGSGTYGPWLQVADKNALGGYGDIVINPLGGNVGIGTSSPGGKLHVSGGRSFFAASSEPFAVGARYSAAGGSVYFGATDATATPGVQISAATGAALLNITTSGNVGIGTSSPGAKLQVNGRFGLFDNSQTVPTPDNGSVPVFVMSGNFSNGGGETSLWNSAATLTGGIRISQVTGSGTYNDMAWFQKNLALFYTANTERMRIDSSGNVGIGTSSPGAKLEVKGAGNGEAKISTDNNAYAYLTLNTWALDRAQLRGEAANPGAGSGTGSGTLSFWTANNSALAERMRIDSSGNVGIGTSSPAFKLDVNGRANISQSVVSNYEMLTINQGYAGSACRLRFINTSGGNCDIDAVAGLASTMAFRTADIERMRISSTGIVTMSAYGAGAATFSAAGVISSVSDETWKIKDGVPVDADSMLKKLEPGYWFYNEEKAPIFGTDRQLGFYAQNVNEAIGPEAAPTPEEGKPWGYYDRSVLAVTVMSLQKALTTIEALTARLTALEAK